MACEKFKMATNKQTNRQNQLHIRSVYFIFLVNFGRTESHFMIFLGIADEVG